MDGAPNSPRSEQRVGELAVTWLGHATVLIEIDGCRLLSDPVLHRRVGALVRVAPPVAPGDFENIDAVLLSHLHADHTDVRSLRRFGSDTRVIAPTGAARWLTAHGVRNVEELALGEWAKIGEVGVWATPARHGSGRWRPSLVRACGFVMSGSQSCYFAGDTDLFGGMARLSGGIDLALLPIAGWGPTLGPGHLDPARAADATALIAPRAVVPIHWGTLALPLPVGLRPDADAPARAFAELAGRRAPGVEVRILPPGERYAVSESPNSKPTGGLQT
jgi:L-ascorbate metabolism protein UlaG (beta-lactamase superfamily)